MTCNVWIGTLNSAQIKVLGEGVNIHFTLLSRWPVRFGIVGGLVEELCGLQSKGSLMEDYKEQEQARYQEIFWEVVNTWNKLSQDDFDQTRVNSFERALERIRSVDMDFVMDYLSIV